MSIHASIILHHNDELNDNLGGVSFGYTEDGKPGWKDGADTVHPFRGNFKITINCSVGAYDVYGIFSWNQTYDLILTSENGNITTSSDTLNGTRQLYGNYFQPAFKINSISISYE